MANRYKKVEDVEEKVEEVEEKVEDVEEKVEEVEEEKLEELIVKAKKTNEEKYITKSDLVDFLKELKLDSHQEKQKPKYRGKPGPKKGTKRPPNSKKPGPKPKNPPPEKPQEHEKPQEQEKPFFNIFG